MKTLTNVAIDDFNEDAIRVYFDLDGVEHFATLSIGSHTFENVDESFAHEFGVEKDSGYEFDAKLYLTYLEDSEGVETTLDEDVLVNLKKVVLEEMQEMPRQDMYEMFH
ncbi:MAG: hypothetical protein RR623_00445 [Bacilli bacterium]